MSPIKINVQLFNFTFHNTELAPDVLTKRCNFQPPSDSIIANVRTLVRLFDINRQECLLIIMPSSLLTIEPVDHPAYQPLSLATITPINHSLLAVKPNDYSTYQL